MNNAGVKPEELIEPREQLRINLGVSSLENTFANFKKIKGVEQSLRAFKLYAEGELGTPMLLCVGGYGCGKTHLLEALVIKRYQMGLSARVMKFHKFLEVLKNAMAKYAVPTYDQILGNYMEAKILCLDDIGMGNKETPWVVSVLESLIDHRYHNRLETVMTTNMDITELPPRVLSRLNDRKIATIVRNNAEDYRYQK